MTTVLAHRGPDGAGFWLRPGVAFGHRRLAVIDLDGGAQPMHTADGALTVVFNGEIYNFELLRRELEAEGLRFRTRSDTEVLLQGWRAWREGLFARLQGQFAFALWDEPAQTLVLARDHMGKKPLHYLIGEDGGLAFASEIKALLTLPQVDRTLCERAVADFFAYGYVPDPKTIYRAIRKLPPAHYLLAQRGRAPQIRRYWSLLETLEEPRAVKPAVLAERLCEAVKRRLIADVPLGALLSGGVDSSAIVALMASQRDTPVETFSVAFEDRDFDETPYATAVSERYATHHRSLQVNPDDFRLIQRLPEVYDEPFGDASAVPTLAVCALARRSVTVALSGDGGDEALAGYRRYAFQSAVERVRGVLPAPFRAEVVGRLADLYPKASWLPRPLRAKSTLRELSLDPASAYARICSALPVEVRAPLFTGDFHRSVNGYDPGEIVREAFLVDAPLDPLQRMQYADLMTWLPGDILTKTDRASMANSLELRSPMLDPDFFALSFGLPARAKLSLAGQGKAILKSAMEPYLPKNLLYRRKRGFSAPVARWLRGPLRGELLDLASSRRLRDSGMIEGDQVRRLAREHLSGIHDHSKALWLLWVFDSFLAQGQTAAVQAAA